MGSTTEESDNTSLPTNLNSNATPSFQAKGELAAVSDKTAAASDSTTAKLNTSAKSDGTTQESDNTNTA